MHLGRQQVVGSLPPTRDRDGVLGSQLQPILAGGCCGLARARSLSLFLPLSLPPSLPPSLPLLSVQKKDVCLLKIGSKRIAKRRSIRPVLLVEDFICIQYTCILFLAWCLEGIPGASAHKESECLPDRLARIPHLFAKRAHSPLSCGRCCFQGQF